MLERCNAGGVFSPYFVVITVWLPWMRFVNQTININKTKQQQNHREIAGKATWYIQYVFCRGNSCLVEVKTLLLLWEYEYMLWVMGFLPLLTALKSTLLLPCNLLVKTNKCKNYYLG